MPNWDTYFLTICNAIASKSPCLSRQIGAIIVRENSIISTGYNGPARGLPHCELVTMIEEDGKTRFENTVPGGIVKIKDLNTIVTQVCPRKSMGFKSGEGLEHCPATHAEANCIANAARLGVSVRGASLYMNTQCPCKDCMSLIVNAGLSNVIVTDLRPYHRWSLDIAQYGQVKIRRLEA